MKDANLTGLKQAGSDTTRVRHVLPLERFGVLYTRIALGVAFLSAVADRFGLWGKYGGWKNFANFEQYTAQVNSFMPAFMIPFLAWAATAAELSLGIALILGIWTRWVARGAAALLFLFGTAMAISFGIKSPLDYSVFSASAGALLLSLYQSERDQKRAGRVDAQDEDDKSRQTHTSLGAKLAVSRSTLGERAAFTEVQNAENGAGHSVYVESDVKNAFTVADRRQLEEYACAMAPLWK